ncbi:Gfo/Idh/MocA family protein [Roseivirga thermotolerans]|uniref:Oxidoreductase n=1 Tax=Roseivirga thermotolerans TaxID=1758176 RepID=A0ABQ3I5Y3_9BACT|nr:Gfo/Idh/MocA family oxidoreductase [Roseivirga thermotolerans]GHE53479.1 oxidoreductase [Roseivirga thermotolerans]
MRVLVAGFGSIGRRHTQNLLSLGVDDIYLLRTKSAGNEFNLPEITDPKELVELKPDAVIVATPTSEHISLLNTLIDNNISFLCEKPLVHKKEDWARLRERSGDYSSLAMIGYNMRFHPVVKKLVELVNNQAVGRTLFARFFVGQYLPDWRPGKNHLEVYSAHKEQGGGVVLDLVHEIDMADLLFGEPLSKLAFISERVGNVTVDADDVAEISYISSSGTLVNIHLDYLFRGYKRDILISGEKGNIRADLFKNTISTTGVDDKTIQNFTFGSFERNDMYLDMLKDYIGRLGDKNHTPISDPFNDRVTNTIFEII